MDEQLDTLEKHLRKMREKVLADAPAHIRQLGRILRRSVETDSLVKFRHFLREHDLKVARKDLPAVRDYLIINRIDLKDLEPAARERLRARMLIKEDPRLMSEDYRNVAQRGEVPSCRDCRWFVIPPEDGDQDGEKSCVAMGTKGADQACYGFTLH
jgi:hypothetical protein